MKYFFYLCFLIDEWCKRNTNKSGFESVDMGKFRNLVIEIPAISRQKEIVEILDKFDTLVNDISKGLPREIELRRKQYEYYRERLVNFEGV